MAAKRPWQLPRWLKGLESLALPELYPRTAGNATAWRYSITVPCEQITPTAKAKASLEDLEELRNALVMHFGGVTPLPHCPGYGLRDPSKPDLGAEHNINCMFVVYASPIAAADRYFETLQRILQKEFEEGVILIEKQEVLLL